MSKERFLELCRKYFGFLSEEFGFREAKKESSSWGHILYFKNDTTAVRVSLEWEYPGVFVHLYRLVDGQVVENPIIIRQESELTNYSVDDLLSIRAPELGLSPIFGHSDEIEKKLESYASAVRAYAADVLEGDFTVFAELDKIVKRRAQTQT
jgi:hypothetical protein